MKNFSINWTFPVALLGLGCVIGQAYLAQDTQLGWWPSIGIAVVVAALTAWAANGAGKVPTSGAIKAPGGEGQGPVYSRYFLVFLFMLIVMIGAAALGHSQR